MSFTDAIFIVIVLVTAAGALMTVLARPIVYALLGLVGTMFGIAGLYVYLNASFIAMMQILIYVGAISILIAFAIILLGPLAHRPREWKGALKLVAALVVTVVSLATFVKVIAASPWLPRVTPVFSLTTKDIGRVLFDRYMLPFELISLLIVVAIIGAVMLVLLAKEEK